MKIRTDFVTNSSSTSYVLELPSSSPTSALMEKYKDDEMVKAMIGAFEVIIDRLNEGKNSCGDDTCIMAIVKTKEDLDAHYVERESYYHDIPTIEDVLNDCSYTREEYDKALASIKEGNVIAYINISNHDALAGQIFNALNKSGIIKVLGCDG